MKKEMDELRRKQNAADKAKIKHLKKLNKNYRQKQVSGIEKRFVINAEYIKKVLTGQVPVYHSAKTKRMIYGIAAGVTLTAVAITVGVSVGTHDYKSAVSFDLASRYDMKDGVSKNKKAIDTYNAENIIIVGNVIKEKTKELINWDSSEKLVKIGNDPVIEALKGNSNVFEYYFAKTTGTTPNFKQVGKNYSHVLTYDIATGKISNIKSDDAKSIDISKIPMIVSSLDIKQISTEGTVKESKVSYSVAENKMANIIKQLGNNSGTTLSKTDFEALKGTDLSLYDKDSKIVTNGLEKPSYINITVDKTEKDTIHYNLSFDKTIFPEFTKDFSFDQVINKYNQPTEGFARLGSAATSYSLLHISTPTSNQDDSEDIY